MTQDKFQSELDIIKFWEENQIYDKLKAKNKGNKPFNFVEGPPYPTGDVHLGHMRNWAIKDSVLRFRRSQGNDVVARDGYDVHGLPVEQKVQKKLGIDDVNQIKNEFGVDNFIQECRKFASEIINDMKGVRKRYGFWIDTNQWETSHTDYISFAWHAYKRAHEKGLLFKDFKCVAWSPGLQTTLSDYEVKDSYAELEDPSVYVRFKIRKENTTTNYDEYLLIWTTTPWTLEANQAIAVNKHFDYAKVLVTDEDGEYVLVVGEPLVEQVIAKISKTQKIKSHKVVETISGADLVGIKYEHIYLDENPTQKELANKGKNHSVLHADFVSLGEGETHLEKLEKRSFKHDGPAKAESEEGTGKAKKVVKDGTGLAHEAPAHGIEDFELCREEGIDYAYCVVNERGLMIDESRYAGKDFRDANKEVIDYLVSKKHMLHAEWKVHTYPLCWRSKVPIVYRTTEQWYIKRSEYIPDIVKANSNVSWFPKFAQTSFNNLISDAGDWAISRQRFWGTPVPVFEDEEGNYEVMGSKEELESKTGVQLEDLHLDNLAKLEYKNDKGNSMRHVGYTSDVWFDSGCASFCSHIGEGLSVEEVVEKFYPASWITEGEDQIRGWFSSLFNVGYLVADRAPYNQVLFQGFVMAKDGQKMSKSLGNGITGNEAIERYGSDATRYYLLTKNVPESKLNFDMDEFVLVDGYFNTLKNIVRLVKPYLDEHELRHPTMELKQFDVEDMWILYRLNVTLRQFNREMHEYRLNTAFKLVEDFIVRDFSKTYLKLVKERLEERDENLLVVLNEVLKKTLIMQGCATPMICEELYQELNFSRKNESLFLENSPEVSELFIREVEKLQIDENFELAQEIVQSILNAREKAKIGVRWPLGRVDIASSVPLKEKIFVFEKLIKKLTNVLKIEYDFEGLDVNYIVKPNFVEIKRGFSDVNEVIKAVNLNKHYIANDIKDGKKVGTYEGVELDLNKHIIKEVELKGDLVSSEFSLGTLILETAQDEILLEEGYLRELFRRVQDVRKALGLNKKDEIVLSFAGSDEFYLDLIGNWESMILKKVGAKEILSEKLSKEESFEIKDKKLVVSVEV